MCSHAPSGKSNHPRARGIHPSGALACTLWRVEIPPGRFGARGLHPSGALARTLWPVKSPLERFYPNHPGARGLLSGTENWGTQRGGANSHKTLMLPNRQEHNYTSCPTTEGWLRLARPLRAGSATPDPRGLDSTSPDVWGRTPPRPMSEGWLCLARPPRAGSASPDPRGLDSTSPDVSGQTSPRLMS